MENVCEFCLNTGYVQNVEYDNDSHNYYNAGLIECKHPHNHGDNPNTTE